MPRYRRYHSLLYQSVGLIIVPLALVSVGYALFSQDLSIATTTRKPSYTSNQGMMVSYGRTVTYIGPRWQYDLAPFTVTNNGPFPVTSWTVTFTVPSTANNISCTGAVCSRSGTTMTVTNTTTNGNLAVGASVTPTVTFRLTTQTHYLDDITISGMQDLYQQYSGLGVTFTRGKRTRSGQWYRWPYTFTVTNSSGFNMSSWRIVGLPWTTTNNRVNSLQTTVNYVSSNNGLTITSKTALNNGSTFVFTGNLESRDQNWVLSTPVEIKGIQ